MNKLMLLIVALFVAFIVWQVSVARARREAAANAVVTTTTPAAAAPVSSDAVCRASANAAIQTWGGRAQITFSPPPWDLNAWAKLHGDIVDKITAADEACGCEGETCARLRSAMGDLRTLVAEFDASIRSGVVPADLPERQQAIGAKVTGTEWAPVPKTLTDTLDTATNTAETSTAPGMPTSTSTSTSTSILPPVPAPFVMPTTSIPPASPPQ